MTWTCLLCRQPDEMPFAEGVVRDSTAHTIVRCQTCGHVQLCPVPSEAERTVYYAAQTQRVTALGERGRAWKRRHVQADTLRRVQWIRAMGATDALDVGCGEGFVVEALPEVKAEGIEMGGMVPGVDRQWSCVTIFHVLEHVPDAAEFVAKLWRLVRPGGHLLLEVPNHDCWLMRASPGYQDWHYQLAHVHYFTPRTLFATVARSGIGARSAWLFCVQRYSLANAQRWLTDGTPDRCHSIGWTDGPLAEECQYRTLREQTLTGDTLCLQLTA